MADVAVACPTPYPAQRPAVKLACRLFGCMWGHWSRIQSPEGSLGCYLEIRKCLRCGVLHEGDETARKITLASGWRERRNPGIYANAPAYLEGKW